VRRESSDQLGRESERKEERAMTESEALEIVRDRVRRKGLDADAELKQALSTLKKAILVRAGALTWANEDDRILSAACDAADSIPEQDVRNCLKWKGYTDLAESSTLEDLIDAAVSSVHDLLLPLTTKDSQAYWDIVEGAARELVRRAGLNWTEAMGGTA
jgi:hypothetical protein